MSDLQIWLIVLGVLLVVAVFAYNKIQESRARRRAEAAFGPRHDDVLLDGAIAPPAASNDLERTGGLGGASVPSEHPVAKAVDTSRDKQAAGDRVEHRLGLTTPESLPTGAGPLHDPRADFIAVFVFAEPAEGEAILRHAQSILHAAPKAVAWEGLSESGNRWVPLSPRDRYSAARPALQLVDRRGRITEDDLNAFCAKLQELAVTLVGELHLPSRSETLRTAERLDAFCSEVDIQIGLNIVKADGARMAGPRIRQMAEAQGCRLDRDGRFRRHGTGGSELFSIANLDSSPFPIDALHSATTSGLTVVLDVPRAPPTEDAFAGFREVATKLTQGLEARMVDDNHQPISPFSLQSIATEVTKARDRMRAEGIESGSPLALRLFA